jgi:hypothetical protein
MFFDLFQKRKKGSKEGMNEQVILIGPSPPLPSLRPKKKKNYWSVRNAPFRLQQGDVSLGVSWMRESLSIDFWSI